jgi:hypothetical protein
MANAVVSKLLGMFGMGGDSAEQIDDFDEAYVSSVIRKIS